MPSAAGTLLLEFEMAFDCWLGGGASNVVEVTEVVDVEVVLAFGPVRKVEVTILSEMGWMLSSDVVLEIGALVTGVVAIELPSGVGISSVIIFSAIIEAIID